MMTITTKEAERFARWCDTDGFTERATALRSLAAERDALRARVVELEGALRDIVTGGYVSFTCAAAGEDRSSEDIIRADRDAWPDYQANDPVRALGKEGDD
jgi:hypothetical protein